MTNTQPNLGNIISSPRIRKIIYAGYALAAIAVGGFVAYFLGVGSPIPELLVGLQAVVAYLGIPIGGLALANTPTSPA